MSILAIDIGGTNIKYATWDNELGVVKEAVTPHDSLESLLKVLEKIVAQAGNISGIAVSMPGFIDSHEGIAYSGGSLAYIREVEIKKLLEVRLGYPVTVENDARAAARAELVDGSLVGVNNAVVLLFGTALGGAVIVENTILSGANLLAGEFSFFQTDIEDMDAEKSSLSYLCGARGLSDCVFEATGISGLDGRQIFTRIKKGDTKVLSGLRVFCSRIVWFLYNLEVITNPDIFAIGGGISQQPIFIEEIKREIERQSVFETRKFLPKPRVVTCEYKAHANLVGAVYHFLIEQNFSSGTL